MYSSYNNVPGRRAEEGADGTLPGRADASSWPYTAPGGEARDARRFRAATAPERSTTYSPSRPTALPMQSPAVIHRPDSLFFTSKPPTVSPGPAPEHSASALHRHRSAGPPQWPYDSYFDRSTPPVPPLPPPPPPPPPAEDIPTLPFPSYPRQSQCEPAAESTATINVTSRPRMESSRQAEFLEKLSSQEEDDLARALEESMRPHSSSSYTHRPVASGSSSRSESWRSATDSQMSDDEAFARRLAAEDEQAAGPSHLSEDEALARQLAAQEEEEEARLAEAGPSEPLPPVLTADEEYARRLAAEEELEKLRGPDGGVLPTINAPAPAAPPPPPYLAAVSPGSQRSPSLPSTDSSLMVDSSLYRSNSAGSASSYLSSADVPLPPSAQSSRPASADVTSIASSSPLPSSSSLSSVSEGTEEQQPVMGGNQFVDQELLRGVSIGFVPPAITPTLQQMQNVMPNIISLPYGRCPPLHFMAPNWRHLLKLMARLSGTRMEPTVEAMAVVKTDLHLRVVIQFIRPHHASMDWRTVVWFTIDHPVPVGLAGARKYTNGDVEVLPWSYTLSSLPNVLRDSSDSPLSKTYTIPATVALPYPKLPISFPNLALYLQAALDESRRYAHDSSSGFRKLSKMMDICYPSLDRLESGMQSDRTGVGGLFRKVMGRGSKNSKNGRRGNEDTYELVTPFVPDEWG